jgi:hypothetical protein
MLATSGSLVVLMAEGVTMRVSLLASATVMMTTGPSDECFLIPYTVGLRKNRSYPGN